MNSTTCSCSTGLLRFLLLLRKKRMKKRYITVIRFSLLDFQPFSCNRASGMFIVTKHKSLTLPDSAFSFRKSLNKKSFLCFSAYSLSIRGTPFFVRLILCRKLFKRISQLQVFFLRKKNISNSECLIVHTVWLYPFFYKILISSVQSLSHV